MTTFFRHHAASVPFSDTALFPVTFSRYSSGAVVTVPDARSPSLPPSFLPLYSRAIDGLAPVLVVKILHGRDRLRLLPRGYCMTAGVN